MLVRMWRNSSLHALLVGKRKWCRCLPLKDTAILLMCNQNKRKHHIHTKKYLQIFTELFA